MCLHCIITYHSDHKYEKLQIVSEDNKQSAVNEMDDMDTRMGETIEQTVKSLNELKKILDESIKVCVYECFVNFFAKILRQKRTKISTTINDVRKNAIMTVSELASLSDQTINEWEEFATVIVFYKNL